MKKVLFSALFAACASLSLSACMNGDYDATPDTNNGTPNPLGQTNGGGGGGGGSSIGTAAKGEIRFVLNGTNVTYSGAGINYTVVGTNDRLISGGNTGTSGQTNINLLISNYTAPTTYTFSGTTASSPHGNYTITPFGGSADDYNTATGSPAGSGQVVVTSDANNEMIGTFSFTAYNKSGAKMTITNGSFDVLKF